MVDVLFLTLTLFLYCFHVLESWSSLFDKPLHMLIGFDLSGNVHFDLQWLMLHKFIDRKERIA